MTVLLLGFFALCWWAESQGVPQVAAITGSPAAANWEGKELRFGIMGGNGREQPTAHRQRGPAA